MTGSLEVDLPPDQAFELFTPRGERRWVPGWEPRFPADSPDDSAPGTVFQTHSGGLTTTWVVVRRTRGRHLRYSRVVADRHAGTVDVRLEPKKKASTVTVSYDLTALHESAGSDLESFASGFVSYLGSWQKAIAHLLAHPGEQAPQPRGSS